MPRSFIYEDGCLYYYDTKEKKWMVIKMADFKPVEKKDMPYDLLMRLVDKLASYKDEE